MSATPETGYRYGDERTETGPKPIGGWLIVAALWLGLVIVLAIIGFLVISPFIGYLLIADAFGALNEGAGLGTPIYITYIVFLLSCAASVILGVIGALRFLRRSRRTPRLMIAFNVLGIVTVVSYAMFFETFRGIPAYELLFCAISAAWMRYFQVSKRVNATFVR